MYLKGEGKKYEFILIFFFFVFFSPLTGLLKIHLTGRSSSQYLVANIHRRMNVRNVSDQIECATKPKDLFGCLYYN